MRLNLVRLNTKVMASIAGVRAQFAQGQATSRPLTSLESGPLRVTVVAFVSTQSHNLKSAEQVFTFRPCAASL